jgi:hypothetical protein
MQMLKMAAVYYRSRIIVALRVLDVRRVLITAFFSPLINIAENLGGICQISPLKVIARLFCKIEGSRRV